MKYLIISLDFISVTYYSGHIYSNLQIILSSHPHSPTFSSINQLFLLYLRYPYQTFANFIDCCGNHLSQRQMITQTVNLLVGYQVGNSQENLTRSLCLIRALYILNTSGPCYNLMSASFPTQGHHVVYMCPDVIFQIFPLCSRLMTSQHVTCHVTAISCASSSSLKRKIKRNSKKRNIKSRKIDKRKKNVSVKAFHNIDFCSWYLRITSICQNYEQ